MVVGGGGSCPPSEPPHFCLYLQTSSLAPAPAFLTTPAPSPLGIELLIAFFHVEVSHFLQLCQGSPELRRGWAVAGWGVLGGRQGEDNKSGGGAPQGTESSPSASSAR